ncbi:FUSC family protein [Carnobacterium gallinarum]|uniref:FUSC family protein n=1 Tax=Carnobacterium gallinarum TaxID=2749 RepID=UPI0005592FC2|nr:aromatic acid exporter family protein [Carnobacterium gallinarum]
MELGHFRLGMRTVKTGIAVGICIFIFHFLNRGTPMIASLAAVFALRQDVETTVKFGKSRILGNSIGALVAALFIFAHRELGSSFIVEVIGIPLCIMFIIILCDGIDYNSGIIGAIATLLIIYFTIPTTDTFIYALDRVVDTFIGTFIALAVNHLIKTPIPEKVSEINEEIQQLDTEKAELTQLEEEKSESNK